VLSAECRVRKIEGVTHGKGVTCSQDVTDGEGVTENSSWRAVVCAAPPLLPVWSVSHGARKR
jgi:hypothetical protein